MAGEERSHQADRAGSHYDDWTPLDALSQSGDILSCGLGIGVQDAVGGDWPHLGNEDSKYRLETIRKLHQQFRIRIGDMSRFVAVRCGHNVTFLKIRRLRTGNASDLHVS